MSRLLKYSKASPIILILLFHLLYYTQNVFAAEPTKGVEVNSIGIPNSEFSNLATSPPIFLDSTGLSAILGGFIGGTIEAGSGIIEIGKGTAMLALPDISGFVQAKGIWLQTMGGISLAAGLGAMWYSVLGTAGFGKALLSFVGDPREFYPNTLPPDHPDLPHVGKMKMIKKNLNTGNFEGFRPVNGGSYKHKGSTYTCSDSTDCAFLGMRAKAADQILVCSRNISSLAGFFGSNVSCYGKGRKFEYAEGPGAYLCPEEARQVGRLAEPEPDKETGYRKLKCTKHNLNNCEEGTKMDIIKKNKDLETFKLGFGSPVCQLGRSGETLSMDGYKYKVFSTGTKLCAKLVGIIGGIPWPQSYKLGCIEKLNTSIAAKCPRSVPIFENFEFDQNTGLIINNGYPCLDKTIGAACTPDKPQARIIKYDDSDCYNRCAVSQMCNTVARGVFNAPIPITGYLMGCIKDSVGNLLYGCSSLALSSNPYDASKDSTFSGGLLAVVQKRMRPIILTMLLLSIILFAMQLTMFDSMPKVPEIMAYLLKIALVLYLTNVHNSENGIEKYGNYIDKISTGLQTMVLANKPSGVCNYGNKSYKLRLPSGNGGTIEKDFSYLKMWDVVDCHLAYYFSVGLKDAAVGVSSRDDLDRRPFDNTSFDVIASVLNSVFEVVIILIATFLFGILNLFIVIQVVELMILATVAFHVLILISPIFVPFLLFKATKQTFDGWVNQIITYSLYPVMIFAFLSFMYIIVDQIYFGSTSFVERESYVAGKLVKTFDVDNTKDLSGSRDDDGNVKCNGFKTYIAHSDMAPGKIPVGCDCGAIACMMNSISIGTKDNKGAIFGPTVGATIEAQPEALKKFELNAIALLFIIFVMYHFAKLLPQITQALSGSTKALMKAGGSIRNASSRMDGLGGMVAGLKKPTPDKKKEPEKEGDGKTGRPPPTSASAKP